MNTFAAHAAERDLIELSQRLTEPGKRECLGCYLARTAEFVRL